MCKFVRPLEIKIYQDSGLFINPVINLNLVSSFSFSEVDIHKHTFRSGKFYQIIFGGINLCWTFKTEEEREEAYQKLLKLGNLEII